MSVRSPTYLHLHLHATLHWAWRAMKADLAPENMWTGVQEILEGGENNFIAYAPMTYRCDMARYQLVFTKVTSVPALPLRFPRVFLISEQHHHVGSQRGEQLR